MRSRGSNDTNTYNLYICLFTVYSWSWISNKINGHIMSENNKSKKKRKNLEDFLKNCEGHSLYMIIQGTVHRVGLI